MSPVFCEVCGIINISKGRISDSVSIWPVHLKGALIRGVFLGAAPPQVGSSWHGSGYEGGRRHLTADTNWPGVGSQLARRPSALGQRWVGVVSSLSGHSVMRWCDRGSNSRPAYWPVKSCYISCGGKPKADTPASWPISPPIHHCQNRAGNRFIL